MSKKDGELIEKIDFQTNNPRKLFRAISDLLEDQMIKRNYVLNGKNEPTLEGTGIHGVAEFEGNIDVKKTLESRSKQRAITGIFIIIIGIATFLFRDSLITLIDNIPSELSQYGWIAFVIIGLAIIISKAKTELIIEIDLKGESYQYKGSKQTEVTEERQRLDVVSDIRISIAGFLSEKSHY